MKRKSPQYEAPGGREASPLQTGMEALSWAVSVASPEQLVRKIRERQRKRLRRRIAYGGTALAAVGLFAAVWRFAPATPEAEPSAPRSMIVSAPPRTILPDGSTIEAREGARWDYSDGRGFRRVVLHAGEAHFQVAKDGSRPFSVIAADVTVRAVGTAFSVARGAGTTEVLVTEGRVAVSSPSRPVLPTARKEAVEVLVEAGSRVVVPSDVAIPSAPVQVSPEQQKALLAWRVPRLEFSGTPLREAIPLFNRLGGAHLILDSRFADCQLSGSLRADNVESLLVLLEREFGIVARPSADGRIMLGAAKETQAAN